MQKAVRRSPSTISGNKLPGLTVAGLAALLSSPQPRKRKKEKKGKERRSKRRRKKKKEDRNEGTGMPGPVENTHSRKSPQQCWGWFLPVPGSRASL